MDDLTKNQTIMTIAEENEKPCWGCGLRLLLPPSALIFKCGWCGAITDQNESVRENKYFRLRRMRDRCFVCILFSFMLFVICGGVWAAYPVIFAISDFCGIFHCLVTATLSVTTATLFFLASFKCAGTPPIVSWGSYPLVGKNQLENYKFCHHCAKPKSPRSHHCRSCGVCVLDMDHHCPFIGNCVGAANHWHFIMFLIFGVISTVYVAIVAVYASTLMWPSVNYKSLEFSGAVNSFWVWSKLRDWMYEFLSSAVFLSPRGLLLIYLLMASVSVNIGLSVLLWQQLYYIYEGKTYIGHLSSQEADDHGQKDCKNVLRFFECPYSISRYVRLFGRSSKTHRK